MPLGVQILLGITIVDRWSGTLLETVFAATRDASNNSTVAVGKLHDRHDNKNSIVQVCVARHKASRSKTHLLVSVTLPWILLRRWSESLQQSIQN